ncbi:MAG: UDP-N-acetylmuramoyl-tripeptide--D-alanyl-D-alanine ligase [Proteobacteria bacterium]|nr:UDP-N-acetylmuramoyl-tripeptide--D-alanyl-D-alanine ligase [Pseudomonadota bacterium]
MKLNMREILDATRGHLAQGAPDAVITGVSIDSRRIAAEELFVPLTGSNCDGHVFISDAFSKGARASLVQRGNALMPDLRKRFPDSVLIAIDCPLQALGDLACFWRKKFDLPVVAITGSNGKTTTKEMVWQIARLRCNAIRNPGNFNNLIGLPLSLLQLHKGHQVGIMEMGMSARGEIERLAAIALPQIGVITNIGPAHLEHLQTMENIMAAKGELFAALTPDATAVVNQDDERVVRLAEKTRARIISFGMQTGDVRGTVINQNGEGTVFMLDIMGARTAVTLALPGGMFLSNALAAAAVAHALHLPLDDIKNGLEQFQPMPGRMEIITLRGMHIINDAYNANPVSVQASLTALSHMKKGQRTIAVLGDMLELGERAAEFHRAAGSTAARIGIDYLYLCGSYAGSVAEGALAEGMPAARIRVFATRELLAEQLGQEIQEGDWILVKGSRATEMERTVSFLQQPGGNNHQTMQ